MKWRLFRNKKEDDLLLNSEDAEAVSRPMAVLYSLVVAFVCVALVFCLFLGGRWVYRQMSDDSEPSVAPISVEDRANTATNTTEQEDEVANSSESTQTPTPSITLEQVDGIPNTGPEPE